MQEQIQKDTPTLLDTVAVASLLGVSAHYVIRHSSGPGTPKIKYIKLGRKVRFEPSAIRDFIAARASSKKV